jgi:hypothetical protein
MADRKVYEHDGYAKVDPNTGVIEIVDPDGLVSELAQNISTASTVNGQRPIMIGRISMRFYEMTGSETETAKSIFRRA